MKKLASFLLVAALTLSLVACSGGAPTASPTRTPAAQPTAAPASAVTTSLSGPVELQFWHSISNKTHLAILEQQIADFNAGVGKDKGITVVPTFNGSSSELYSSVVAGIKAGSAPDVTLALRPYVADYLQTEYVVDLSPYITDSTVGIADYNDIFAGLRGANSNYAKPGVYSLPINSYAEVLYYNTKFFADNGLTVPTTWDELTSTSRKITEITGAPAFGWDNLGGSFMTLVKQLGGHYTDQSGKLFFTDEEKEISLKVLKMWQDNVKEGIWRIAGEDMFLSGPFANEIIPMYIGDSVEASYIPSKNPNLEWGTAPIPQMSNDTAANLTAGHVITALNTTGDKERAYASYEFMKHMTSYEANLAVAIGGTGYLPIRQSVVDAQAYKDYIADGHDFLTAGVSQSDRYFYEPVFTNDTTSSSAVISAVKTMMADVAVNGLDPETALNNLKQTVGAK